MKKIERLPSERGRERERANDLAYFEELSRERVCIFE